MDYGGSVVYLCLPSHCFGSENGLKLFSQTNNVYFISSREILESVARSLFAINEYAIANCASSLE